MKWPYVPTKNSSTKRKKDQNGALSEETVSTHDSPINESNNSSNQNAVVEQHQLEPEETLKSKRTKFETCQVLTHAASTVNPEVTKHESLNPSPNISPNYDGNLLITNQGHATQHVQYEHTTERLPSISALQHMHNDM